MDKIKLKDCVFDNAKGTDQTARDNAVGLAMGIHGKISDMQGLSIYRRAVFGANILKWWMIEYRTTLKTSK